LFLGHGVPVSGQFQMFFTLLGQGHKSCTFFVVCALPNLFTVSTAQL
jgi:hypothetical protein